MADKIVILVESAEAGYKGRTREVVSKSDFTLIVVRDPNSAGTKATIRACEEVGKQYLKISLSNNSLDQKIFDAVAKGLSELKVNVLNVAGNGLSTIGSDVPQRKIDVFMLKFLTGVLNSANLENKPSVLVTGGQTGIDEAAIKAASYLGLEATIVAPKGYLFRDASGKDVSGLLAFQGRFTKDGYTVKNYPAQPLAQPLPEQKQEKQPELSRGDQFKKFLAEETKFFNSLDLNKVFQAAGWLKVDTVVGKDTKWVKKGIIAFVDRSKNRFYYDGQDRLPRAAIELFKKANESTIDGPPSYRSGAVMTDDQETRYAKDQGEYKSNSQVNNEVKALTEAKIKLREVIEETFPAESKAFYANHLDFYNFVKGNTGNTSDVNTEIDKINQLLHQAKEDHSKNTVITPQQMLEEFTNKHMSMFKLADALGFRAKEYNNGKFVHPEDTKAIVAQADLVELVGKIEGNKPRYVEAEKAYFVKSPFLAEAEMKIFPGGKSFFCEGSKKSGNVIDYLRERKSLEFTEAVKYLSNELSLPLTHTDSQKERVYFVKEYSTLSITRKENDMYLFYDHQSQKGGTNITLMERELKTSDRSAINEFLNKNKEQLFKGGHQELFEEVYNNLSASPRKKEEELNKQVTPGLSIV